MYVWKNIFLLVREVPYKSNPHVWSRLISTSSHSTLVLLSKLRTTLFSLERSVKPEGEKDSLQWRGLSWLPVTRITTHSVEYNKSFIRYFLPYVSRNRTPKSATTSCRSLLNHLLHNQVTIPFHTPQKCQIWPTALLVTLRISRCTHCSQKM